MSTLSQLALRMSGGAESSGAWKGFEPLVRRWVLESAPRRVLEIGGGRNPLLSPAEVVALPATEYVVNDISPRELERLDDVYGRVCFNIEKGPAPGERFSSDFDFVFSRMVFEHLKDPAGAWTSVHSLLKPGGVGLMFMPVLFSPPFVANRVLPERVAAAILRRIFPRRNDDDIPKFPAYYRWCRASERYMQGRLRPIGFRRVEVLPFYGHAYFVRVPILRNLDRALTEIARRKDWAWLASYAYVIVTK